MTPPRNVPASVRQRLLNRARSDRRPFNELLQYFAMERFLYRLSRSDHVVASIAEFLSPITAAVSSGHPSPIRWNAPGPWT